MLLDITLPITPKILSEAQQLDNPALAGHLGTHFDSMDKEFPLSYTTRKGIVFDVSSAAEEEIGVNHIDLEQVERDMFVAFYTGFAQTVSYGESGYFSRHPVLSMELIEALLDKGVSIIGLDFAGVRRGKEHIPTDQLCADRGTFVIENLVNLDAVLEQGGAFTAHTYPLSMVGFSGLPCRVIAETPSL